MKSFLWFGGPLAILAGILAFLMAKFLDHEPLKVSLRWAASAVALSLFVVAIIYLFAIAVSS